jgi:hypothetical protein
VALDNTERESPAKNRPLVDSDELIVVGRRILAIPSNTRSAEIETDPLSLFKGPFADRLASVASEPRTNASLPVMRISDADKAPAIVTWSAMEQTESSTANACTLSVDPQHTFPFVEIEVPTSADPQDEIFPLRNREPSTQPD